MKKISKTLIISLLVILFTSSFIGAQHKAGVMKNNYRGVKIFFTSDLHSCADMYPYLAKYMKQLQKEAKDNRYGVITLDAGDIAMGTLYSLFYELYASEYRMLALMNYDAFVFGNHDFDVGLTSLGYMVYNSRILGHQKNPVTDELLSFPINITANISGSGNEVFTNALKYLQHTPYVIFTKAGYKIGVFGLLGNDAYSVSRVTNELDFQDPIESAKPIVKALKEKGVDYIVALSHSGAKLREDSEDFALAKACPDIDLIISGHDHEALIRPLYVGKSAIVSAGYGGKVIGEVTLNKADKNSPLSFKLHEVPTNIEKDPAATRIFDSLDINLITLFNTRFRFAPDYTVATNPAEIAMGPDENGFYPLNYEVAKALYVESERDGRFFFDKEKLVTVVPSGVVRNTLPAGEITYADVYNVLPLGRDTRSNPGYPLILSYLTGKELKKLCEINTSVAPKLEDAYLTFYNLTYTYNSKGIPFCKVKDVFVGGKPVEDKELYPVVTDSYTAGSISVIKKKSHGFLNIVQKDENGNQVININKRVLSASGIEGMSNADLTGWLAYSLYLKEGNLIENQITSQAEDIPSSAPWIYLTLAAIALIAILVMVIIFVVRRARKGAK